VEDVPSARDTGDEKTEKSMRECFPPAGKESTIMMRAVIEKALP
jgi:hypothetical protein